MAYDGLLFFMWVFLDVNLRTVNALAGNMVVLQLLVSVLLLEHMFRLLYEKQKEKEGR